MVEPREHNKHILFKMTFSVSLFGFLLGFHIVFTLSFMPVAFCNFWYAAHEVSRLKGLLDAHSLQCTLKIYQVSIRLCVKVYDIEVCDPEVFKLDHFLRA